ncbi:phage tail assembly chaperone [Pseudomonas shirazica]
MYYSDSTGGFYSPTVHTTIPDDAVVLSADEYGALKRGLEQGKKIALGVDGQPCLADREIPYEELIANERLWRDGQLPKSEWLTARHRDELDMSRSTTLTAAQYNELLAYRQALRDWPQAETFLEEASRPQAPAWMAEHIE